MTQMEFVLNSLPLPEDKRIELLNLLYEDRRETVDKLTDLIVKNLQIEVDDVTENKKSKVDSWEMFPHETTGFSRLVLKPDIESVITSKELYINDLDLE